MPQTSDDSLLASCVDWQPAAMAQSCGRQILNRQTFKKLFAYELFNLTSLVDRF